MKHYIGTKLLLAIAMTRQGFLDHIGRDIDPKTDGGDEGYLVEYCDGGAPNHPDHKGFISWSPKEQFEAAYLPVGDISRLQPHQQRVVGEKAQLDDKLEKLTAFLSSPRYAALDSGEQHRLSIQINAMRTYSRILGERIKAFGGAE